MSDQFIQDIKAIHAQVAALDGCLRRLPPDQQQQIAEISEAIAASFESLQLTYEEMQTNLEAYEVVEEQLLQQGQEMIVQRQHYHDLFQFAPDAYLITDTSGLILEANQASATLLNVPQHYLLGKPLAVFVPETERSAFRARLNQLSQVGQVQDWEIDLRPRNNEPFAAKLKVVVVRNSSGWIEALRISVHDISQYKQAVATLQPDAQQDEAQAITPQTSLPSALDGLQVLVVDDEIDAREFITAVLESHRVGVTAVATAAEALAILEQSPPDVLVSDIRMPDETGYSLIQKLRELEARKGWHIPAGALTAYLVEDREKALTAGFESHLHKLAQPAELVEMVARLAGRAPISQ